MTTMTTEQVILERKGNTLQVFAPYTMLDSCRSIISGKFNKQEKCWEYPITAMPDVLDVFGPYLVLHDKMLPGYIKEMKRRYDVANKLITGELEPPEHPFLMRHQRVCLELSRLFDRYPLFLDTGTGKTLAALAIINDNRDMLWLVLCPKAVIKTGWLSDQRKFYPDIKLLPISRNIDKEFLVRTAKEWGVPPRNYRKDELKSLLASRADVLVVNPESFKADLEFIKSLRPAGLIIDESAKIKDPSSQITKDVTAFANTVRKLYILSGKPAPNNELEYFPQMRIIDPAIFGTNFYKFRNRFFVPTGYGGYKWLPKPGAAEEIAQRLARKSYFVTKDECLDLPEKTYITRDVELTDKARRYYNEMERQSVLELENTSVIAEREVKKLMKLRQITSGFVFDADADAKPLHTCKLNELLEVLDEIGNHQVIIWCQFQPEIRLIEETLKKMNRSVVTAYGGTKDIDNSIEQFKSGKAQYMVAHPRSIMYGVTFTNCTSAVYYSLSYSFEEYYQSHDRIYRKGQSKPCTFIFLIANNTIDEVVQRVVKAKAEASDNTEAQVRSIKHITDYVRGVLQ